jgi:alkanesulfonate monooxygenase SsuD/methylene tetrahydromethanopterin reductase-like flavin-dependent oxidoreductase (luciferase family)
VDLRPLEVGLVLPTLEDPLRGEASSWEGIRAQAGRAEQMGFDTVWVADELLWKIPAWSGPRGSWECVAMTGAVAASTTRIKVGTWVLSALHRNPGLTAKVVETLDEISGGRFILGFGAGHAGTQGEAFGFPLDKTVGRYEEALEIIIPLLREGNASYEGEYHSASDLIHRPWGPRPNEIPIMLAGHGPRNIGLAVKYGDIWSAFATESSLPEAFSDMMETVNETCEEQGRDPSTLGRSVGVFVEPTDAHIGEDLGFGAPLTGSSQEIATQVRRFAEMGFTMLELVVLPNTDESVERMGEVLQILDA